MTGINSPLDHANHSDGMKVPEGYFADFQAKMMQQLPQQPAAEEVKVLPRSFWQRVRPYVYLAAMFAGIWCMMQMFSMIGSQQQINVSGGSEDADASSSLLAEAAIIATSYEAYVAECVDMSDYELYEQLYDEGFEIPDNQ